VWTEAIYSYKTNSDSTFSDGSAFDKFCKGPIQLDTEFSMGVAMLVAALEAVASVAMASMAMAAQWMTAKQVAVLQAAALQMTAWWESLAVLAALEAVRHTAKAVAVWMAKVKAVRAVT
jgi:hypothetical protein